MDHELFEDMDAYFSYCDHTGSEMGRVRTLKTPVLETTKTFHERAGVDDGFLLHGRR